MAYGRRPNNNRMSRRRRRMRPRRGMQMGGQAGMGRSVRGKRVIATSRQCLNPQGEFHGTCLPGCSGPPCGQQKPPGSVRGGNGGGYDPYPQNSAMPGQKHFSFIDTNNSRKFINNMFPMGHTVKDCEKLAGGTSSMHYGTCFGLADDRDSWI